MLLVSTYVVFTIADSWYRTLYQEQELPDVYIQTASKVLHSQGLDALKKWLGDESSLPKGLSFFVLDQNREDILGRELPEFIHQHASSVYPGGNKYFVRGVRPTMFDSSGQPYTAYLAPAYLPFKDMLHLDDKRWYIFLSTLLIEALVCFFLVSSLTSRLKKLTASAKLLSEGHLDVRVGLASTDEVGALAQQFDRMAVRLEEIIMSRQRMFRNISHEMRSPLARIQVAVDLLEENPSKYLVYGQRIEKETKTTKHLLDDILDLARLEDPQVHYEMFKLDFIEVVSIVYEDAKFEAKNKNIDLILKCKIEYFIVNGNAELISSAIENIVRNAIRFSSRGSAITINTYVTENNYISFEVIDSGPGVPEEQLVDIFKPFFRISHKDSNGSGIGLSICALAAKKMNGFVAAKNNKPAGLSVTFSLPQG